MGYLGEYTYCAGGKAVLLFLFISFQDLKALYLHHRIVSFIFESSLDISFLYK